MSHDFLRKPQSSSSRSTVRLGLHRVRARRRAGPKATLSDDAKHLAERLENAERTNKQLREAIDMLPQGVVVLDREGRYVLWNQQYADIYKRSADLFEIGVRLEDTLRIGVARGDYPEAKGREEQWIVERVKRLFQAKDRHEQWISDGRCILIDERLTSDGGVVGLRIDISELKEREASFRMLFEANPVPMFVVRKSDKGILSANAAALRHYGFTVEELSTKTLLDLHHPDDHAYLDNLYGGKAEEFAGQTWRHIKADQTSIDVAIYSSSITQGQTPAILFAAIDITERKAAEAKVAYLAHHDALTGLANRVFLRKRLDELLASRKRSGNGVAVLCIDLDNFKVINDSMGHAAGDSLLQQLTTRIQGSLRKDDIAARLGGDEFAVVLANANHAVEVSSVAQRIIDALREPFAIDDQAVNVTASVGIALCPSDGETAEALLKNADLALYQAKGDGKGCYRYFEAEMNVRVQARRKIESELHHAYMSGGLEIHYQPLVTLNSGEVSGFEALLRWPHSERGFIPPSEFIPIAEECGLIAPITDFVLHRACQDATTWPKKARLAVNMSPQRFRIGNVFQAVSEALKASGLEPERLELEITEALLLENSESVLSILHSIRSLGVRISMDDFGTGYSSLSYLRMFPFDKIKIDGSFVRGIGFGTESQAIIRAIMGLGSSLGMTITAEGIETESEQAFLRAVGCDEGQGFLYSKARPVGDVPLILDALNAAGIGAASGQF
ncbi:EAL domain-containing protein [Hyphomicrobium sp.]|uniref:putative bifunctional diguanylate cyclase/phosphodiesterase n=1 Tax=Hyphomicrobium sp. TaxID=82 RepID=UPI000FA54F2F|nr:EAL domain-containing protein [Hyphomicrobium sp.]RUO97295.1 MAG: EAL domain-containing protein [Hyphomicrobium sp.]